MALCFRKYYTLTKDNFEFSFTMFIMADLNTSSRWKNSTSRNYNSTMVWKVSETLERCYFSWHVKVRIIRREKAGKVLEKSWVACSSSARRTEWRRGLKRGVYRERALISNFSKNPGAWKQYTETLEKTPEPNTDNIEKFWS